MEIATQWKDYELLDSGEGVKLERWGSVILARPEPQALWLKFHNQKFWERAQAVYNRTEKGKGAWTFKQPLPDRWHISYGDLKFWVRPTDFKHTGLFPEQAVTWSWLKDQLGTRNKEQGTKKMRVLNLFGYTGGATLTLAKIGVEVTHVDASEGVISWAKENATLSQLTDQPIRWIVDDAQKFVAREERRGAKYDGIIMDPPSYGRGKRNELWKIEEHLWPLVQKCTALLSDSPLFFVINSYTTGMSATTLENVLRGALGKLAQEQTVTSGELGLSPRGAGMILPAGIFARWEQR